MASKDKNNRTGFLFMFIIIILLLIILYAYRDKFSIFFKTGISQTDKFLGVDFKNLFAFKNSNQKSKDINISEKIRLIDKKDNNKSKKESKDGLETKKEINNNKNITEIKRLEEKEKKIIVERKNDNRENLIERNEIAINKKQEKVQKEVKNENEKKDFKKRISKIYFTKLDDNDRLVLKSVNREVTYYNTPLTETIKELFKGPTGIEKEENYLTNIPKGTKVLRAWIKDEVLYLDLSNEFENNNYGKESAIYQLKQIVFTATEFPNVKKVKFLINGKEESYLGGEGIFIGKPLGRADF